VSQRTEDCRKPERSGTLSSMQAISSIEKTDVVTPSWLRRLLATDADLGPAIARVALGLVMFPHGAQKVLGWFGGYGLAGTYGFMTTKLGIPGLFALLAIAAEFLGALALIAGVGSRIAAFGIAMVMIVAALMVHVSNGFFMNWTGAQGGEGFEYHLLALALAAIVLVRGGGKGAIDRVLASRL
jgi:putative oxidoreductase